MRVKLTKTWASADGCGKEGDIVDVPTKVAKQLIKADAARPLCLIEPPNEPTPPDSAPRDPDPPIDHDVDPADHSDSEEPPSSDSTAADAQGDDAANGADPSATQPPPAEGTPGGRRPLTLGRGKK